MDYHEEGYREGYADGYAGRPMAVAHWIMDFLNDKTQQEYDDGYREGYRDGEENRRRDEN